MENVHHGQWFLVLCCVEIFLTPISTSSLTIYVAIVLKSTQSSIGCYQGKMHAKNCAATGVSVAAAAVKASLASVECHLWATCSGGRRRSSCHDRHGASSLLMSAVIHKML